MFGDLDKAIEGNPGRALATAGQVTNATTFGNYDRLMGGLDQLFSRASGEDAGSFGDSVDAVRANRQSMREMHPVSSGAGDVAGLIAGGFAIDDVIRGGVDRSLAKLPQAKGAIDKTMRYGARLGGLAGDGLAQYGAWTLGARAANREAEEGRDVGIPERLGMLDPNEAAISAAAGPLMSGMYRGGRGVVTGRMTPKNVSGMGSAPSLEAIEGMKNEAYKLADDMGVTYSPDGFADLVARIETRLADEGVDSVLHQRATRNLKRIQDRVGDQPITMQELDRIRQFTRRDVVNSSQAGGTPGANDGEMRLGMLVIDEIDDFIENGASAIGRNGEEGSEAIRRARSLNTVWRKSQMLQDAFDNAQLRAASTGTGGNFENALRQELRKILQNPKKVRGFNDAERKMMRAAIEGNSIQNIQRLIGKFSPEGNGLMGMMGVGGTFANPAFAAVPITGFVAKRLAEKGARKGFEDLDEAVRGRANAFSQPPMKNITPGTGGAAPAPQNAFNPTPAGAAGRSPNVFTTSTGNEVVTNSGKLANGDTFVDFSVNGSQYGRAGDSPNSLGETNEILRGVGQEVRRIIANERPERLVIGAHTDQQERIYRALLERAEIPGYRLSREMSQGGPMLVLTRSDNPTPAGKPVNPDEFFTDSQKGSAVMSPEYPSNAIDDALQRMGTPESQLGQRVDDGIIGLRRTMNESADQFEQMVASNPGKQSYVFSLPDDPRVGREAVERMLKYRDQMRWGPSKRSDTVLVMSADGGDLALVDRALTNRGGPFATTEATQGAGVNWFRLNDLADFDAVPGSANNVATRGNRGILGNQRGNIVIDGRPMRRQDAMREARAAGGGSFPTEQPAAPPQQPANAFAGRSGGVMDSPLVPLGVAGGAGVGGMVAYNQMRDRPEAAPQGPVQNAFASRMMSNANTALDDINTRREQGLPKTPGLKPRRQIDRNAERGQEQGIQDAIRTENRRSQEYWQTLEGPDRVLWNQIKQKRANELKVTPEDRRNGIRDKRLPYSYETPVSELETAPIEVLLNGEWISETALANAR
ncbi:MAG: hypothetical protein NXH88_14580 [Hyphomonas sp.]|nr:hypothetical protein [Hyphomonas sp.]